MGCMQVEPLASNSFALLMSAICCSCYVGVVFRLSVRVSVMGRGLWLGSGLGIWLLFGLGLELG